MTDNFKEIIKGETPVLVDFFATWCGPCQVLGPILVDAKEDLGDAVSVIKIDVDKNQELADALRIKGLPTLIIYKEGQMIWRQSGELDANTIIGIVQEQL